MNVKITSNCYLFLLLMGTGQAFGSANSNGVNGINSAGLVDTIGMPLTGDGIDIGPLARYPTRMANLFATSAHQR